MAMHAVIVVFAPVAVVGNAVVLAAIWKRSFQRTTFHTLLTVLALTDFCTGIASALISVPNLLYSEWNNTTSLIGLLCTTYLVSETVLVITLMSVERWLHMTRRSLLTLRRGYPIAVMSLLYFQSPSLFSTHLHLPIKDLDKGLVLQYPHTWHRVTCPPLLHISKSSESFENTSNTLKDNQHLT